MVTGRATRVIFSENLPRGPLLRAMGLSRMTVLYSIGSLHKSHTAPPPARPSRMPYNEWRKADRAKHPGKYTAQQSLSRATKNNRTPAWANLKKIERVYQLAAWASKFIDEPLHVDHIIPMRGKFISGLHVENNLQILPRNENSVKGNKFAYSVLTE